MLGSSIGGVDQVIRPATAALSASRAIRAVITLGLVVILMVVVIVVVVLIITMAVGGGRGCCSAYLHDGHRHGVGGERSG